MKELTIEEKACRYDEALKVASKYKDIHIMFSSIQDEMFPELAESESEDERIRKALIKLVKKAGEGYENVIDGVSIENAISWLEKQGEQKPWSEEDERIKNNLLSELTNLSVRKLIKKETEKKYASWLKNIKDRVQPQPKQEWSEEDKEVWAMVISLVERQDNISPTIPLHEDRIKMLDWLKSLRPQKWRPTEDQIMCLQDAISNYQHRGYKAETLESLCKQLKQL